MKKNIKKVVFIVGARPNFIKIGPIMKAMKKFKNIKSILVHTGQHYSEEMSKSFFRELEISKPDIMHNISGGTHATQTGKTMIALEKTFQKVKPCLVVVVGDVNATMAGALSAAKMNIPVAHVEAGLRSFDPTMPEEINRIITDSISSHWFTTERQASENLIKEGHPKDNIYFVGNVMIDTLLKNKQKAEKTSQILVKNNFVNKKYALFTVHRPENVDKKEALKKVVKILENLSKEIDIIFPCHPRTQIKIKEFGLESKIINNFKIKFLPPLGYIDFLKCMIDAVAVITDSGGVQEETTALGIPCITIRKSTERPITVTDGTNVVTGLFSNKVLAELRKIILTDGKKGCTPELWDGKTGERIAGIIRKIKTTFQKQN